MTTLISVIALAIVAALLLVRCLARPGARRGHIQNVLLDFFLEAGGGQDLLQVAVDADWVALRLGGLEPDTPIGALPASAQARVLVLREEVIAAAEDLIHRNLVARLPVAFPSVAKNQVIRPPRGLFMLTARGAAIVLSRSTGRASAA